VQREIRKRDKRDSSRAVAPLEAAADALVLDTSELSREEAVAAAIELAGERLD